MAPRAVSGRHASRSDRAVSPSQSSARRMREDRERERERERERGRERERERERERPVPRRKTPGVLEPFRVRARLSGGAPL